MAQNLWELREQKKLSVAALANRAGLPIGLIMEYESGMRAIDPRHLARLARVLYVDEAEIKLQSDARPGAGPLERQRLAGRPKASAAAPTEAGGALPPAPRARERAARPRREPRPPAPARPSQLSHLQGLLAKLNRTEAEIEAEVGKPLAELDRVAMSALLKRLQEQAHAQGAERHRAYLPESVDAFEARYLAAAQEAGDVLQFTLFDGGTTEGQVIGFGPYTITIRLADGAERTLNKLALVSYTKAPASAGAREAGR